MNSAIPETADGAGGSDQRINWNVPLVDAAELAYERYNTIMSGAIGTAPPEIANAVRAVAGLSPCGLRPKPRPGGAPADGKREQRRGAPRRDPQLRLRRIAAVGPRTRPDQDRPGPRRETGFRRSAPTSPAASSRSLGPARCGRALPAGRPELCVVDRDHQARRGELRRGPVPTRSPAGSPPSAARSARSRMTRPSRWSTISTTCAAGAASPAATAPWWRNGPARSRRSTTMRASSRTIRWPRWKASS